MAKNTEKVNAIGLFSNMKPVNQTAEKEKVPKEPVSSPNKGNIPVNKKEIRSEAQPQEKETAPMPKEVMKEKSSQGELGAPEAISKATVEFYIQKKRERKKIHKSFTIPESINNKFVNLAQQSNMSENELLNTILEQVFKDYH